jgi:O-antigen ligase
MSHGAFLPQAGNASLLGAAGAPRTRPWSALTYMVVLLLAAMPAGVAMIIGHLAGNTLVGATVGILPLGVLILWRPEIGVFVFALYIPFSYFGVVAEETSGAKVLGLYTGLALIMHLVGRRHFEMRAVALWLAVAFVAWNLLSIFGARQVGFAWAELFTVFQMMFLLFVVVNACTNKEQVEAFLWCLFFGGVIAACGGFFLTPVAGHAELSDVRLGLGGQDINQFAKEIMPAVFLAPYLASRAGRGLRFVVLGMGLIVLVAIVMTGSRSAYFGAGVGIVVAVLTYRSLRWTSRVALLGGLAVALVAILFLGMAAGVFNFDFLLSRFTELQERGLFKVGSRGVLWSEAIRLGFEHPLLGVGSGNFIFWMADKGYVKVAHNDYLNVLADTGFPGLVLFVGFLLASLGRAWRSAPPALRAGFIGLWIFQMIACMGNPSMHSKGFWLQAAGCILVGSAMFTAKNAAPSAPAPLPTGLLGPNRRL